VGDFPSYGIRSIETDPLDALERLLDSKKRFPTPSDPTATISVPSEIERRDSLNSPPSSNRSTVQGTQPLSNHQIIHPTSPTTPEDTRRRERSLAERKQAVRLFYSYSHKDERLRDQLETHLKLLQREGLVETWHDRKIEAGEEWKQRIDENLERADIILLLVSADFIASGYCYEKEMKEALERQENGEARVIPVILRDVDWSIAPFARLQALPRDGQPVISWRSRDSAWRNVAEGVKKVVEEMRGKSRLR
jgi:internalin A